MSTTRRMAGVLNNMEKNELYLMLGEMQGDLKGILNEMKRSNDSNNERFVDLEKQVRVHQTFIDNIRGKVAIVATLISIGGIILVEWFKTKVLRQ